MTATYGAIGRIDFGARTNTTIPLPASVGAGDHLTLVHVTANNGTAVSATLPVGWTALGTAQTGTDGSFGWRLIMGTRTATASESNPTLTHASTSSEGLIIRVDGTGTLSVDVFSQANRTGVTTEARTAPSVTTTVTDALLLYVCLNWDEVAFTPPTGMTEQQDAQFLYLATQALVASGATGTRAVTGTTPNPWFANLIAIKDVAGGGTQALTGTSSIMQKGTTSVSGRTGMSGKAMLETAGRIAGVGGISLYGKATVAAKGVASRSGRSGMAGRIATALSSVATRSGSVVLTIQTRIFPMMRGTLGAGIPLSGKTMFETAARGQVTGSTGLSGQVGIETSGNASRSGRAALAALAAVQATLRGVTASLAPGTVALVATAFFAVKARATGAGRAAMSGTLQVRVTGKATTAGRVAIAARTMLATAARIVPPGSVALFGRATIALRGAANGTGRAALAGATAVRSAGRAVAQALGLVTDLHGITVTVTTASVTVSVAVASVQVEIEVTQ